MSARPTPHRPALRTRQPIRLPVGLRAAASRSLSHPRALRRWLGRLVLLGLTYAGAIALLGTGGGTPGSTPWLAIPRDSYFLVESLFTTPVVVAAALLAASTAYLLAKAFGSPDGYDATLVTIARATCIATLWSLVPDLFMGVTTTLGIFDGAQVAADLVRPSAWHTVLWTYLTCYTVAFLALYPAAVRAAHPRLRAGAAWTTGWAAFLVYQGVLLVFIR